MAGGTPDLLTSWVRARWACGLTDQKRRYALPLVVVHGARPVWRHQACSMMTMPDQGPLKPAGSAKNPLARQPEEASIELLSSMRERSWQVWIGGVPRACEDPV